MALRPYPNYASLAAGRTALRNLAYSLHVATVTIAGYIQPGTHFDPDLIAAACSRVSRDLTPSEWQLYIGDESYQPACAG